MSATGGTTGGSTGRTAHPLSPTTRRIARSYLGDLLAAGERGATSVAVVAAVDQLIGQALEVKHMPKSDRLVLVFDLADDQPRANGGLITSGRPYLVGEHGSALPEPPPSPVG